MRSLTVRSPRMAAGALVISAVVALTSCGSSSKAADTTTATAASAADTTAGASDTSASDTSASGTAAAGAVSAMSAGCTTASLAVKSAGKLTIGTDKPAYPPWFMDDTPTNGKGFESAVGYAIADTLGFAKDSVEWKTVAFNSSYAPGSKAFDFDLNQISITPERKAAVDFSDGYYEVNQAVVALNDSPAAAATTLAELKKFKFGAQVGTTSLDFIKNTIGADKEPFIYDDTNGAKVALTGKQIDAIVVDLPTAFYITSAEIDGSKVVGQFPSGGGGEEFGALLEKGSKLTPCINEALAILKGSGKLAAIQESELATATKAILFK